MPNEIWINHSYFTKKWIERAERNGTMFDKADRFIALWIAFNGWMRGKYGEDKGDAKLIKKVKASVEFKLIFNDLKNNKSDFITNLNKLRKYTVVNMKYINNVEKYKRYNGTFESLIEIIYQIRCNLFHGRKETYGKDYRLVCLANDILSPLFKKYLQQYGYD